MLKMIHTLTPIELESFDLREHLCLPGPAWLWNGNDDRDISLFIAQADSLGPRMSKVYKLISRAVRPHKYMYQSEKIQNLIEALSLWQQDFCAEWELASDDEERDDGDDEHGVEIELD